MEQGLTNSVVYENTFVQHTKSNVVMDVRNITNMKTRLYSTQKAMW